MNWATDLRHLLRRTRHGVGPGDLAVPYMRGQWTSPMAFLAVMIIEIFVVEFLVPWPWLSHSLTVVSVVSLPPVLGLLAGFAVRPHVLGPDRLLLRLGARGAVEVPRDVIEGAVERMGFTDGGAVKAEGGRLAVSFGPTTNVELRLTGPYEVALPKGGTATVRSVIFQADEPAALLAALREKERRP